MLRYCLLLLLIILSGCLHVGEMAFAIGPDQGKHPDVLAATYTAADYLHSQLEKTDVAAYPMLAASFVDSSNLDISTDLGRLVSEQVASRLSQLGYSIVEVQLRSGQLALDPTDGVFLLSRDLAQINIDADAYAVLVGTYTIIERQIYVNARVLRSKDGVALAATDFVLPLVKQRKSGSAAAAQPSVQTSLQ